MNKPSRQGGVVTLIVCVFLSSLGGMFLSIESARMFIEKQRMGSVIYSVALYLASLNQHDASLHGNAILNSITKISEADSQAIFR